MSLMQNYKNGIIIRDNEHFPFIQTVPKKLIPNFAKILTRLNHSN